jgi:hypothetical protein
VTVVLVVKVVRLAIGYMERLVEILVGVIQTVLIAAVVVVVIVVAAVVIGRVGAVGSHFVRIAVVVLAEVVQMRSTFIRLDVGVEVVVVAAVVAEGVVVHQMTVVIGQTAGAVGPVVSMGTVGPVVSMGPVGQVVVGTVGTIVHKSVVVVVVVAAAVVDL